MNTNILQKCVEELKKETPNISYIQGMLETLIEMSGSANQIRDIPSSISTVPYFPPSYSGLQAVNTSKETPLSAEEQAQEDLARYYAGGAIGGLQ